MKAFQPDQRILMGPGPSDVHPRVLAALSKPTIGHLDPRFQELMDSIKTLLRDVFRTDNDVTFPVSAPGSAGMETCLTNLVEPGDAVIILENGVFGGRMSAVTERIGGRPVPVAMEWGAPVDVNKVEDALKANPDAKVLAFVHAETSTGVEAPAADLGALARQYGCLSVMDAVTSLGGIPVEVDAWGIDAVYSGSQKCLSCPPGLSPVSFSERAVEAARNRATPAASWFLDLSLVLGYWDGAGGRSYHHTAPVNALYGLHEALMMLNEEGLEAAWSRHALMHKALVAGLGAMGLELLVPESCRLPQLNTVRVPDGIDEASVRAGLLDTYSLEIGAGLGPLAGKVWRVGLMGQSANRRNVMLCLAALEETLTQAQMRIERGAALQAAAGVLG